MLIAVTGHHPQTSRGGRRAKTFRWLAEFARDIGIDLIVVTPRHVLSKRGVPHTATGWWLDKKTDAWKHGHFPIERPVWLDFMYLKDVQRYSKSYHRLLQTIQRSGQPCSNPLFPGKHNLFRLLTGIDLKPGCIPLTKEITSAANALEVLEQSSAVWLKPVYGTGGRNVVRVVVGRGANSFVLQSDEYNGRRIRKVLTRLQLSKFLRKMFAHRGYVVQEEVSIPHTEDGRVMDIRATVQRDEEGIWQVTGLTARIGKKGSLITNYHAGGTVASVSSPQGSRLLRQAGLKASDVRRSQTAALRVAQALEKYYPTLAYLGIDVAPQRDCCYVYDCNTKPGRDILTDAQVRLMMQRMAGFGAFLRKTWYSEKV